MSNKYGPRIVTDGLVCCLDAADRNCYTSGTTAYDLTGNTNNGTIYNSPSIDINTGIISLSSTNDYLAVNKVINAITIECWFNTPNKNNAPIIYAGGDGYNSGAWQWSLYYYSNALYWRPNAGGGGKIITDSVSLDTWYHFVMVRDSTTNVYLNGVWNSSVAWGYDTVTGYTRVGKAGSNYWNGSFAGLKLYNRTLSANEVQQNYNATKGRFGL